MIRDALRNPSAPWLLYAVLGVSLTMNVVLAARVDGAEDAPPAAPSDLVGEDTTVSNAALPPDQVPPLPEPLGAVAASGTHVHRTRIETSLSAAFVSAPGASPAALSAVYARLFSWDVDLRRDLHRGDLVEALYEAPARGEPVVLAARLVLQPGQASQRIVTAWRYQAPGDRFASYWQDDGDEVAHRLVQGPIDDYVQIATLLRDRPDHHGMDFAAPIGVDVVSPRAGTVTRVNWNEAIAGKSVEVEWPGGVRASFEHLNEVLVQPGDRISGGTLVGRSGNSGRSTGAHLHYALQRGGTWIDPMEYHGSLRRKLPAAVMTDFGQKVKEMASQLDGPVAVN